MVPRPRLRTPALVVVALLFAAAAPAVADDAPGSRERGKTVLEPHRAPPMTPPAESPPAELGPTTDPDRRTEPDAQASIPAEAPRETGASVEAKNAREAKTGNCSVYAGGGQEFSILVALVLMVLGANSRRRH